MLKPQTQQLLTQLPGYAALGNLALGQGIGDLVGAVVGFLLVYHPKYDYPETDIPAPYLDVGLMAVAGYVYLPQVSASISPIVGAVVAALVGYYLSPVAWSKLTPKYHPNLNSCGSC